MVLDILNIHTEDMFYLTQYNEVNKVYSASVYVDTNGNLLKHFKNLDLTKLKLDLKFYMTNISQKGQYFQAFEKTRMN